MTSSGHFVSPAHPGAQPYGGDFISPRAKKTIFWSVLGAHFILILCPLLWHLFINWLVPQPKVLKVHLVETPISTPWDVPSKHPSPERSTPSNTDSIPDPGEVEPIPEPPKPEPVPEPKPEPTPKPEPKPKPVETPKKTESPKKIEPKKSNILKPEDIIKSSKTVKPIKRKGQPIPIEAIIKSASDGIYSPPGGGGGPKGVVDLSLNSYFDQVSAYLYGRWQQPGKALLGGANPTVDVKISVDASGRILSATVIRKSGMLVMDSSVERLFADTTVIPPPPKGAMEFTIKMMIIDD